MGDVYRMDTVGRCYRNGIGIPVDMKKANRWFRMKKVNFTKH